MYVFYLKEFKMNVYFDSFAINFVCVCFAFLLKNSPKLWDKMTDVGFLGPIDVSVSYGIRKGIDQKVELFFIHKWLINSQSWDIPGSNW